MSLVSFQLRRRLLAIVLSTMAGVGVATAEAADAKSRAADAKASAAETAKQVKKSASGSKLAELMEQLRTQRTEMMADHDALAKKLKEATDAEKKAIKEKMDAQIKAFEAQQGLLHKQIRDEQRRLKQGAGGR